MSKPDAALVQQIPTGADNAIDVGAAAANRLREYGYSRVAEDLEKRIAFGEKKYGQRLRTNNGRNCILDSYQEVLDLLNYLMQGMLEGNTHCEALFEDAMSLAAEVEEMLVLQENLKSGV